MPAFTELYDMLSIYSLIKQPIFGNSDVCKRKCPSMSDTLALTSAFQDDSAQTTKLEELKRKLDGLVNAEVECEDVFDPVS